MAEIKNTWGKRALAGFGALALASAGLLGGSTAASATTTELGNINHGAKGSITVHKHEHQSGDYKMGADGSGDDAKLNSPIADVEFVARKITSINLEENADWAKLKGLKPNETCESLGNETLGDKSDPIKTNSDGIGTFEKLSVGAYLVCETKAPNKVVDRALPFIVTIPLPFQNGWLYDVNVYPKNGVAGIEKTIDPQQDMGLGSVISFPVTTDIPVTRADDKLTRYVVSDTLDPRLSPDTSAARGAGVASVKTDDGVEVPAANYTVGGSGQTVTVTFTDPAGLNWLKANSGKKLVTTFQTVVTKLSTEGEADGQIKNDATVFINTPNNENELTSKPVTTNWGDVRILKYAEPKTEDGVKAGLAGAIFKIYAAEAPYAGGTCEDAKKAGDAINVNGSEKFTSGSNGLIEIAGLFVSDSAQKTGNNETQRCYVLEEVQAPTGYVLPADPFTGVAVKTGKTATTVYDAQVKNIQQEVPELPLTGANGQMVMVIGGSALLLIAGGVVMLNRRRSANEQQN